MTSASYYDMPPVCDTMAYSPSLFAAGADPAVTTAASEASPGYPPTSVGFPGLPPPSLASSYPALFPKFHAAAAAAAAA